MLTSLRLTNFRLHADTELRFDTDAQLILIGGMNGTGKSSLLEAILYGFYGESRHGKRGLDKLVRRGAELEGMEVELSFDVAGTAYRVVRRRDGRSSTAVLYGNDNALVTGPNDVTAEISRILGMDSAGFRLAVIAQQKELDGLASLQPAKRAEMLSRLLRLDALSRAKDTARARFRNEREIVKGLAGGDDIDALAAEVTAAETDVAQTKAALSEAQAALIQIDAELAASAAIDAAYHAAKETLARAEATATAALEEVNRLDADIAKVVIPDVVDGPDTPIVELHEELTDVERNIARGESAEQIVSQRRMLEGELEAVTERLDAVDADISGLGDAERLALDAAAATETLAAAAAELAETETLRQDLRDQHTTLAAQLAELNRRKTASEQLGASCDACGQEISEEHRHSQVADLDTAISSVQADLDQVVVEGNTAKTHIAELTETRDSRSAEVDRLNRAVEHVAELTRERAELTRRQGTYTDQLNRLVVPDVDLDAAYARRGELAVAISLAKQAEETRRAREAALTRKSALTDSLGAARGRYDAARTAAMEAAIDADLEAQYAKRQETVERRAEELELANGCATQVAVSEQRLEAAKETVRRAHTLAKRRRQHEEAAAAASAAHKLLGDVEEKMSTQIRPALEGSVSQLLVQLSEGRFTGVRIDGDYNITVADGDSYQPLTELSGGEIDLVALAVRLALAGVVSDRHGSGGAGFLILDEVFGSQHRTRRSAILGALRNLRATYGQVFCISHIDDIEDAADRVIDLSVNAERTELEVTVS